MAESTGLVGRTSTVQRDSQTVTQHVIFKNIQTFACITPPLALIAALRRSPFRLTPILRTTALSSFIAAPVLGAGMTWYRMQGMGDAEIAAKALKIRTNVGQRRTDDFALIGGALGALATTTVLLRRVPKIWTLTGGAALGVAGGVAYRAVQNYQEGADLSPEKLVDEAKGAIGKKD